MIDYTVHQSRIPERYRHKTYMRRAECAETSGLSVAHFDRLAWKGEGPPFIKPGGNRSPALYPVQEFFDWLNNLGKEETSKCQS